MAFIYDADLMTAACADYFKADYWGNQDALDGEAVGRGSAWFINAPFGQVVLRQYLRGGWIAKLSHRHYAFLGVESSRPFREFNILATLHMQGFPVPRPVAALCEHRGLLSTGALMTARITSAQTLADLLINQKKYDEPGQDYWSQIGRCIRRFHDAGVWHADLNARNIMLDNDSQVFVIDFDRARFTPGKQVDGVGNLKRLYKSLVKLWPSRATSALAPAWAQLEAAYHG